MASREDLAAEREALEDLIRSDGWGIFRQRCEVEWKGGGYFARMSAVLASPNPQEALVVHRCAIEVDKAVSWPERRVTELKGDAS